MQTPDSANYYILPRECRLGKLLAATRPREAKLCKARAARLHALQRAIIHLYSKEKENQNNSEKRYLGRYCVPIRLEIKFGVKRGIIAMTKEKATKNQ